MRVPAAEVAVTAFVLAAACADPRDLWALLARVCQATALAAGRLGLYAEARATVLTTETA